MWFRIPSRDSTPFSISSFPSLLRKGRKSILEHRTADPACYYSVSRFYSRTLSLPDSRDHLEVLVDSLVVFWWSSSGLLMASNGNCTIQGSSPSETLSWNEDLNINKNEIRTIKKSRNTAKHERERQQNLPRESNKKQENRTVVKE